MTNPQAVEALSDDNIEWPDVESMSHSAVQEALSYGLGYDVIHRHMLSVMFKTVGACRAALATQPAPQPEAQALPEFSAGAFIQHAQNVAGAPGHWPDEFLAWYQPDQWLSEERAAAVFLGQKLSPASAPTVNESLTVQGAPAPLTEAEIFDAPGMPRIDPALRSHIMGLIRSIERRCGIGLDGGM